MAITNPPHWKEFYKDRGPKYDKILEIIAEMNSPTIDHATRHQDGGTDEINVAALSGLLADAQTPLAHKTSHQDGGTDEINVAALSGDLADLQDPKLHASAHQPGGGDAMAVDAAVGTGSLRTLGTGALQAAPGDHVNWPQYLWLEGNPWLFTQFHDVGLYNDARFGGGFAQIFGDGTWENAHNFYGRVYIPIPPGKKFRLIQMYAVAYNDGATLYWDRIRLAYAYFNNTTNTRSTGNYFSDVANPFGTSNGDYEWSTTFTGPWMNGLNDGPTLIHMETTLVMGIQDTSSSAGDVVQLYHWSVKAEYADI